MNWLSTLVRNPNNKLIPLGVCLFAVAFSGISLFSLYRLNGSLRTLVANPVSVSSSIYKMRRDLFAIQLRMGKLAFYNTPADIADARKEVSGLRPKISRQFAYIEQHYLGPKTHTAHLGELLQAIYATQDEILDTAAENTHAELGRLIYQKQAPRYEELERILTGDMLAHAAVTVDRLAREGSQALYPSVALSVSVSILMVGFAFFFQHLFARRELEKAYRESVFKIISENVGNVFMLYNLQQKRMEYVSPNTMNILGVSDEELRKTHAHLLGGLPPDKAERLAPIFSNEIIQSDFAFECPFTNPQTRMKTVISVHVYPVRKDDLVTRYILVFSDLTESLKTQQALRDALLNAQKANKAKSHFLSRMSHEIRTPMNAIIGMTTIAATALDNRSRLEDCLAKISGASRHLLMLINDILDMSKIESGKFSLCSEPFQLPDLVKSVTTIIYPQTRAKDIGFDIALAEIRHERLIGDPLRLSQILLNILGNAVKFTPRGGNIRLELREKIVRDRVRLHFAISDTGRGMSPEFLQHLFIPFEQEHSGTSLEGTGLGMAITQNMVSLMHGSISVKSKPGEGTTFSVELDFATDTNDVPKAAPNLESLSVLVVDDDKNTCEHTAIILDRMGVRAEWVLSGKEAVERAIAAHEADNGYDVAFIDWKMPDMDGIEATRRIRRSVGADTLIIIISAYDWTEIEDEARAAGADAFIAKPMFQSTIYNTLLSCSRRALSSPIREGERERERDASRSFRQTAVACRGQRAEPGNRHGIPENHGGGNRHRRQRRGGGPVVRPLRPARLRRRLHGRADAGHGRPSGHQSDPRPAPPRRGRRPDHRHDGQRLRGRRRRRTGCGHESASRQAHRREAPFPNAQGLDRGFRPLRRKRPEAYAPFPAHGGLRPVRPPAGPDAEGCVRLKNARAYVTALPGSPPAYVPTTNGTLRKERAVCRKGCVIENG